MIQKSKAKRQPTIRDVAKAAGVSISSVTRFIDPRKRPELSPETQAKVEKAVLETGYLLNVSARKRRAKKKVTIGILTFPSSEIFRSRYHTEILTGVHEHAFRSAHELKLFILREHHYDRIEEVLYEHGVDGLMILSWRCHPNVVELVEKSSGALPLVIFNDYKPGLKVNVLYTNVREGMKQAVFYLLRRGFKKIALLAGPRDVLIQSGTKTQKIASFDAREKFEGFLEALKEKGISSRKEWIVECPSYNQGESYQVIKEWLGKTDLPEALVAMNDEIALDAWRVLKEFKLWPGEKMALVGFDDIEKGRLVSPSLTTIHQPLPQMGRDAVDILLERVGDPMMEPVQKCYKTELIVRQTA